MGRDTADQPALTHVDGSGHAHMVDVTAKPWTHRRAVARCRVELGEPAADPGAAEGSGIAAGSWGDVLVAAQTAGVKAAERTATLVPLCHPLIVSAVDVRLSVRAGRVDIEGIAEVVGPTGVEMEALTACAVAALTIVSALEATDGQATVEGLGLWEKSGGRSGHWTRD